MSILQAWDGNKNKTKLVVVRFYLYKCVASLNYSLVRRSEYSNKVLTK